jgi:sporulation protein YlmC with PRC-barrel domain
VEKMERAYREDELLDSAVIDSEGYIYGKVGKIIVKEDEICLSVYEARPDERTAVDLDALKEELLKRVKPAFAAKLQRLSSFEVLNQNLRKEFGLKHEEPLTGQYYAKYSERLGIEIPYKKVTEERKEPKGIVTLSEVKTIGVFTIGAKEKSIVIKIILLHEPKEAKFRKIPIQKTIPYRSTETLRDKLVIDFDGLAVGYVDSVVLFRHMPGIRIYTSKPTDSVSLSWLFRYLEKMDRPDIIDALRKYFGTEGDSHIYHIKMDDLEDFMWKTKLTFRVPESVLFDHSTKELVMDIPWDVVHKVGDVVLLRLTLPELKSKGS